VPGPSRQLHEQATTHISTPPPSRPATPEKVPETRRRKRLPLIAVLVLVILLVVAVAAELYAHHVANGKVASAVVCEVQDSASVSFAETPPVLWQYFTRHYTDISVQTGGNQVRSAKGMKVSIDVRDVSLSSGNNSQGTIGALNGTMSWSSDGIKQSIEDAIPGLGSLVASKVTTDTNAGTIELKGLLDSATIKPQVVNNALSLQVVNLSALGSKLSTDTVQKELDDFTSKATTNYGINVHIDSVKVTDTGVETAFSASNAVIPAAPSSSGSGQSQDCFSGL
jgi:hypothetical protein